MNTHDYNEMGHNLNEELRADDMISEMRQANFYRSQRGFGGGSESDFWTAEDRKSATAYLWIILGGIGLFGAVMAMIGISALS